MASSYLEMVELRKQWPMIQDAWLAKPFDDVELSAFIDLVKKPNPVRIQLEGIPLPIRIINKDSGKVSFLNAWPMAQNRPDTLEDIQPGQLQSTEYWHHTKEKDVLLYGINSFVSVENTNQICQIATKINLRQRSLNHYVELIFATMKDAGFLRGRFYQVIRTPDSFNHQTKMITGLMRMSYRSGDGLPYVHLPVLYPIKQYWSSRITSAEKKIRNSQIGNEELTYKLLHHSGFRKTSKNEDFFFWREQNFTQKQLKGIPKAQYHENRFLEIPIFRKKDQNFKCIGFFCFDCFDGKNSKGPPIIKRDQVSLAMKSLWSMINDIRTQIVNNSRVEKRKVQIELDVADRAIKNKSDLKEVMKRILNSAVKISDASSGIIYYRSGFENYLKIISQDVECIHNDEEIGIKDDSSIWPIKAYKDGKYIYSQRFCEQVKNSHTFIQGISNSLLNQNALDPSDLEEWIKNVGSVAIFPLKSGNSTFGALSLHSSQKFFFTDEKTETVKALIDNCRWYVKYLTSSIKQSRREHILFHEIKSKLNRLHLNFQDKYFSNENFKNDEILPEMLNIQNLLNLSTIILSHKTTIERDKNETFEIKPIFEYYVGLYGNSVKIKQLSMPSLKTINRSLCLEGDRSDFELIIGVLFDNAVKFAKKRGKLRIKCEPDSKNEYCVISISNTGKISDDAKKVAFEAGVKPQDIKKDGAHLALSYTKKLLEYYGGRISIENSKNMVLTRFTWPLSALMGGNNDTNCR